MILCKKQSISPLENNIIELSQAQSSGDHLFISLSPLAIIPGINFRDTMIYLILNMSCSITQIVSQDILFHL